MDLEKMGLTTRWLRKKDILASEMDQDLVMLSIESGKYYGMNSVGKRIWHLLENPMSTEDICHRLRQEFRVSEEQCQKEVATFLVSLFENNLIQEIEKQKC